MRAFVADRAANLRDTLRDAVVSHKHQKVAADGSGLIVCFNYTQNKKTRIPEELKRRIEELEGSVK